MNPTDAALWRTQECKDISMLTLENKHRLETASYCLLGVAVVTAVAIPAILAVGGLWALIPLALGLTAAILAYNCSQASVNMHGLNHCLIHPSHFMTLAPGGVGVSVNSQSFKASLSLNTFGFGWCIDLILYQMAKELPTTVSFV